MSNTTRDAAQAFNLLDYDRAGLEALFAQWGEPRFRAAQLLQWLHQRDVRDFGQMTNLAKSLRARLQAETCVDEPRVVLCQDSQDGTQKWLLQLADGNCIETVYIPEAERGTLCISSQVGCPIDCDFCATAEQGFNRNLSVGEIVSQLRVARRELGADAITNVVLMGMGEPLLNYRNVVAACNLMLDDLAYGLSARRVTLSTSGLVPAMDKLGRDSNVSLAISLHATRDEVRDKLVPLNRKYPLAELLDACRRYPVGTRRRITFEYVMLDGVNDDPAYARELARLLRDIPSKVNLIPFNPYPGARYQRSPQARIDAFRDELLGRGIVTVTRRPRGEDIAAACGQLAGRVQDRTRRKTIPLQVAQ